MAKKIVKGAGKLFGIGKKKKAAPADPAATTANGQPVITPIASLLATSPLRKRLGNLPTDKTTILGGGGLLGQ